MIKVFRQNISSTLCKQTLKLKFLTQVNTSVAAFIFFELIQIAPRQLGRCIPKLRNHIIVGLLDLYQLYGDICKEKKEVFLKSR